MYMNETRLCSEVIRLCKFEKTGFQVKFSLSPFLRDKVKPIYQKFASHEAQNPLVVGSGGM